MVSFNSCWSRLLNDLLTIGMLVRPRVGARARTTTDDRAVLDPDAVGKGFGGIPLGCAPIPHGSQRFDAVSCPRMLRPAPQQLIPMPWRHSLMTRVSVLFQDFQDLDAPAPIEGSSSETFARQRDAAFDTLFAIDDELETYLDKLPAIFSVNPVHINYATEARYPRLKVYRQVIIGSVYFIRILLHRPFMLNSRRFGEAEGPYRTCWRRCVDTAIRDLRLRNMWRLTLSETEQVSERVSTKCCDRSAEDYLFYLSRP